nr:tetratricopeptide repeat protein [uncultured Tyzzerella sp.]
MNFIIFKTNFFDVYTPSNIYDKFYQEKKSNNPELYNFQDYNNYCYGYASLKSGKVNLSAIKFKNDNSKFLTNCLVIWVYEKDFKHYILGWYKNADVYNFLQRKLSYPSVGRDLYFNVKAKSKDCYLLPIENRTFNINVNFKEDNNFYIGDKNDSLYNEITNFINTYNKNFINVIISDEIKKTIENAPNNPYLLYKRGSIYLYNENNFLEALKYFNTALLFKDKLSKDEIIDIYYSKAMCLQFLNSFDSSLKYFEKVINHITYDINIIKNIIYLCIYTKDYNKAIIYCDKILNTENKTTENSVSLDEINCLKAECLLYLENCNLAKELLINIKNKTLSKELSIYCENILEKIKA